MYPCGCVDLSVTSPLGVEIPDLASVMSPTFKLLPNTISGSEPP